MEYVGYYEIMNYKTNQMGLKAGVITGNVEFNRLHWHDSLEIFCCIYGNVSINMQGIVYNLKEGDLITIVRASIAKLACMLMPSSEILTKVTEFWREDMEATDFQKYINVLDTDEKWYQFHMEIANFHHGQKLFLL